jgi:hypothetical protein
MKQQKFSIKEEPYEASDETSFKSIYNLTNNNISTSTNAKSFNLRKINANRVYLNSLTDKNVHNIPRVNEKLEAEKKTTSKLNSEKVKFLNLLKLKPIKEQINASNLHVIKSTGVQPKMDKLLINQNFDESKLSLDTSLINQLIKTNGLHTQSSELTNEDKSKTDIILENKQSKVSIFNLNDLKFKVTDNVENQGINCAYDYLFKIGATSVSFESFQHVLFQLKHFKVMNNTSLSLSFNPPTTTSPSCLPSKGSEFAAAMNNETNSIQLTQLNSKFEFIYDENFYWVVKIRKIYNNLFQLKFMRSTSTTSNNENNSGKNKKKKKQNFSFNQDLVLSLQNLNNV